VLRLRCAAGERRQNNPTKNILWLTNTKVGVINFPEWAISSRTAANFCCFGRVPPKKNREGGALHCFCSRSPITLDTPLCDPSPFWSREFAAGSADKQYRPLRGHRDSTSVYCIAFDNSLAVNEYKTCWNYPPRKVLKDQVKPGVTPEEMKYRWHKSRKS